MQKKEAASSDRRSPSFRFIASGQGLGQTSDSQKSVEESSSSRFIMDDDNVIDEVAHNKRLQVRELTASTTVFDNVYLSTVGSAGQVLGRAGTGDGPLGDRFGGELQDAQRPPFGADQADHEVR